MIEAMRAGHEAMQTLIEAQEQLQSRGGKPKRDFAAPEADAAMGEAVAKFVRPRFDRAVNNSRQGWPRRRAQRGAQRAGRGAGRAVSRPQQGDRRLLREGAQDATCARRSWRRACAPMGAARRRSARSAARRGCCRARTARRSSRAARRRCSASSRSARRARSRRSTASARRRRKRYIHHYNFPLVQRRRGALLAWPRPARDRPRRAGRARAVAGDPAARRVPLHHPRRLRGAQLQRLDLDGLDLRQHPGADGRRRADHGAGRRRGDGPDHRERRDGR